MRKIEIIVNVVNNGGGTATSSDFNVVVTGNNPDPSHFLGSSSGTGVKLGKGTYGVAEQNSVADYSVSYSNDCSGTMANGDSKTSASDRYVCAGNSDRFHHGL